MEHLAALVCLAREVLRIARRAPGASGAERQALGLLARQRLAELAGVCPLVPRDQAGAAEALEAACRRLLDARSQRGREAARQAVEAHVEDLRAVLIHFAQELALVIDDAEPRGPADLGPLNDMEANVLESLKGNRVLPGPKLAERAGYEYDHLRTHLPGMVRRGLLVKVKAGYRLPW